MSSTASSGATVVSPAERVEVLFDELAELAGQRNGIDGRIVEIVAELDRDELCGATGARSIAALVAWKMGSSTANANTIATVAHRLAEFPRCAQGMREGRLSLDQVGVIAGGAGRRIRCALCGAGRGRHGQPAAHRGQAGTAPRTRTRTRSSARAAALDHQDHRRGVQLLPDQTWSPRRRDVRRGAAVAS